MLSSKEITKKWETIANGKASLSVANLLLLGILAVIPCISRIGMVLLIYSSRYAREQGLGGMFFTYRNHLDVAFFVTLLLAGGLIYLILPARADRYLVDPQFYETVFRTDTDIRGVIRLYRLLVVAVRLLLDKEFRILIRKIRHR